MFSCNQKNERNFGDSRKHNSITDHTELNNKIERSLNLIEKKGDIKCVSNNQKLNIKLHVYSPSFLDDESQKILLSYINYNLHKEFNAYDTIVYDYTNENFESETLRVIYSKHDINEMYEKYKETSVFIDFVEYVLKNFSQNEV